MATPTITWYYYDGDSWEDMTAYVLTTGVSARYGMATNKPLDRLARPGAMQMQLKSLSGEFDPDDADCLTGWAINTKVKLVITYEGYSAVKWYGYVSKIQMIDNSQHEHIAQVTVSDWMRFASDFTITQQSIETYKRGDQVVDTIVDAVGHTPQATEYATGDYEFEAAFDSMTVRTKAATELNKIVLSEGGYFYNRHDRTTGEKLIFENAAYRGGLRTLSTLPELSTSYLLKAGSATDKVLLAGTTDKVLLNTVTDAHMDGIGERYERSHGENILNKVKVTAYPKRTDSTEQTLYSLGDVLKIVSGETKTINVRYQNADTKESCNAITSLMIQPVATTDYLMNTKKDGTGTNITSDLTVSVVFRTAEAEITLTNSSAYVGKITKLQLRGYGVYQDSSIEVVVEDAVSQAAYSESELNIEQQYQRDTVNGELWAERIVAKDAQPRTVLNKVMFVANKTESRMLAFLALDIGDLVRITESGLNIDGYYYINGVEFAITAGNIITYSWILSEALPSITLGNLTSAGFDFDEPLDAKAIDFGVVNGITGLDERTIIFDALIHNDPPGMTALSIGTYTASEKNGFTWIYTESPVDQNYMYYITRGFTGERGWWSSKPTVGEKGLNGADIPLSLETFYRVAIAYYPKSVSAVPKFYIDGVLAGFTTFSSPTGDPVESEDGKLIIGAITYPTGGYSQVTDGVVRNVCIYNRVLTADEIALDAAGTLITNGIVFRGLGIPTAETTAYYDQELTESQYVYDDIGGAVGVPKNAPTCREIT